MSSVRRYCEDLEKGNAPIEGSESLNDEQLRLEKMSLGFRARKGFEKEVVRHLPGSEDVIANLLDLDLIRIDHGRIIPSKKGFLVADSLPLMFFKENNVES